VAGKPSSLESKMPSLWRVTLLLRPPVRAAFDGRTFGAEHVPAEGPVLIATNHASYLDPWFLGALFPRLPIRFLINEAWYDRSRLWRRVFRGYGVIPTTARAPDRTFARVLAALADGSVVGVFPEGRISRDGRMNRPKAGIGWMAALSGVPVVPCGLRGSHQILPRHRRWPRRHPLRLHIGAAMRFPEAPTATPEPVVIARFVESVIARIGELAGSPAGRDGVISNGLW